MSPVTVPADRRLHRLIAGWIALVALLCLPALHAMHLRVADNEDGSRVIIATDAVAPSVPAEPSPTPADHAPHGHDVDHCSVCLSFRSIDAGQALFDFSLACRFEAPIVPAAPTYVAPTVEDAIVPLPTVPRGPPARA